MSSGRKEIRETTSMSRLTPKIHPLFTKEIIDALHSKHIFTVTNFINSDTQQIVKISRLTFKEVLAIRNFLLKQYSATPTNGFDCYKITLKNTAIIPTGIESVDHLLEGGLVTGNIYEICGLPASGKTQFALHLIKNVIINLGQKVHFIDTKNDFTGHLIKDIFEKCGQDKLQSLDKVMVTRAYTKCDLINTLYEIKSSLESELRFRLTIIDSLPSVILNSNDHLENNAFLNHLVNIMRYISTEHHIVFLITNLVTTWNDGNFKNQQESSENITCGKYWLTVPNTRLKVEKAENQNVCTISVLHSDILNCNPTKSAIFQF